VYSDDVFHFAFLLSHDDGLLLPSIRGKCRWIPRRAARKLIRIRALRADLKDRPFLGDTPSPRSRFSRALTRFLVVAFIGVGCTLAWQSYGETAKQKLATSAPQLGWVLSLAGLKPWPAELIAERSSGPAVQECQPDLPQAVSAAQVTPDVGTPPTSAARAPEVQQQLEAMARDLATLRQSVGQLRQSVDQVVVGQERMARDLASLQAGREGLTPQDLSAKTSRCAAPKPSTEASAASRATNVSGAAPAGAAAGATRP
jgi:TolA-binding protein